jgi:hypothetical protein
VRRRGQVENIVHRHVMMAEESIDEAVIHKQGRKKTRSDELMAEFRGPV